MSIERSAVFKCSDEKCPAILEVVSACSCSGECELACCGQPMRRLQEQTADFAKEKHVPVIEKTDTGYLVKVGSTPHPMEKGHWIQWIELHLGDLVMRQHLNPGDKPEAHFAVVSCCQKCGLPMAREHCNKHGLWKT